LPSLDEKNVEVKLVNGNLTIKGEKIEEREKKKEHYYLPERHFGSFERSFSVPEGVNAENIFKKGVLTVTLPKKPEARKPEKKIEVKSAQLKSVETTTNVLHIVRIAVVRAVRAWGILVVKPWMRA
jgi:HSP20 family protein